MAKTKKPKRQERAGEGSGPGPVLQELNAAQQKAVQFGKGPLLVVAGPGSGKTRVIAHRIAYLLEEGVPARRILGLTFTNKAAGQMAGRIRELAGEKAQGIWTSTFHAFCARLLRIEGGALGLPRDFVIYDADDSDHLVQAVLKEQKISLDGLLSKADLRQRISLLKNRLVPPKKAPDRDRVQKLVQRVYGLYQAKLANANALDFDDLLVRAVELLEQKKAIRQKYADRFLYVLVDEYQDTNEAQARLLKLLAAGHRNVCVTGDPDQAIYGWRGATIHNILEFPKMFRSAEIIGLEQGYRSTQRILGAADGLIRQNTKRFERTLWTDNGTGEPLHVIALVDREAEAKQIAAEIAALVSRGRKLCDVAVLYRVNSLSRALEQELVRRRIPYAVVGGVGFYQRREIKDVLAYLRLVVNPADALSFERIVNVPRRGIGAQALATLQDAARRGRKTLLETVRGDTWKGRVRGAAARGYAELAGLFEELAAMPRRPVADLLEKVLEKTGYAAALASQGEEERLQNLEELVAAAGAYDAEEPEGDLGRFLERVALVTDVDRWQDQEDRVTLMTLHMAKGLEFPVVFIAGMEDGLLPFIRRGGSWWEEPDIDPDALEEERRLCFVGITRARELVVLTYTEEGSGRNWDSFVEPSRFLDEFPKDAIRVHDCTRRSSRGRSVVQVETAPQPRRKKAPRRAEEAASSPRRGTRRRGLPNVSQKHTL